MKKNNQNINLTEGPIAKGIIAFTMPLFWGQLLQQLYNVADAWVIGNFASNEAFAAISATGSIIFMIVGFVGGLAIGGGVIISRFFGAEDFDNVEKAVHADFMFAIIASVFATIAGIILTPRLLVVMGTPADVLPHAITYVRIYFAGVSTVVFYNTGMSIMRALGDSIHPLYYLAFSSVLNVVLDLIFVAGLKWEIAGAAIATVISQGVSAGICVYKLFTAKDCSRISISKLKWYPSLMREIFVQGVPTGIQNAVISVGNTVIQSNINAFGAGAIAGVGANAKIEGFVFLPIMSLSMSMTTYISQNLGAREYERAKKGARFAIIAAISIAEIIGLIYYAGAAPALRFFIDNEEAIRFGLIHCHITTLFYFLLSFSHVAAGVMRGCGKATVPMVTMLGSWCVLRIIYVTCAVMLIPEFRMISWAYPLTWSVSSIVFLIFLLKSDWTHSFEQHPVK